MKRIVKRQPLSVLAIACLGATLATGLSSLPASAQLTEATNETAATIREGKQSQQRINQLDDQIQDIVQDYRETIDHLEALREYNAIKRELLKDQERTIASLRNEILNVADIQRSMPPLIVEMTDVIAQFVADDIPFRTRERTERVGLLRTDFERSDVSTAEKYRKVLEAYQIENDYGRSVESYEGTLTLGERDLDVNFLMVGRAAFFYQTKDQSETGMWDNAEKVWVTKLPGNAAEQVGTAIAVANEFVPPNLLILPLPAPVDAE